MDLLDAYESDDDDAPDVPAAALGSAAHGKKRARDGATASLVPSAQPKLQRSLQGSTDVSAGSALPAPAAPAFRTLDSDTQSASAAARRAANALFERRAAARGDTQEEAGPAAGSGPGERAAAAATAAASAAAAWRPAVMPAAVPLDPARALDTRTLGLLDARARRELGLSAQGQWEGAERQQQQQELPGMTGSSSSAQPWGLPAAPVGGVMEISGRQVRNSGWEAAHLEAMAAAAHRSAGDGAGRRAGPIAATVWNHATGKAEVTTGGGSKASKSKHQIHTLAAAAAGHAQRTADKVAEASIQAVLARQAGGGWR